MAFGKTRRDENCIIFFSQLIKGNIFAHLATGSNLDAGSQYVLDILSKGFNRKLQVEGVGYRAEINAKSLVLSVGFSHPVVVDPPEGIVFSVDEKTRIIEVSGYDKERVGQVAADLRKIRPPEPYKGKGIRYVGERVRHKAGKAGKATATK